MTDTRADIPSVVERMRPLDAEAPVVAAHFLGQTAVFVLGEEALLFVPGAGREANERSPRSAFAVTKSHGLGMLASK